MKANQFYVIIIEVLSAIAIFNNTTKKKVVNIKFQNNYRSPSILSVFSFCCLATENITFNRLKLKLIYNTKQIIQTKKYISSTNNSI